MSARCNWRSQGAVEDKINTSYNDVKLSSLAMILKVDLDISSKRDHTREKLNGCENSRLGSISRAWHDSFLCIKSVAILLNQRKSQTSKTSLCRFNVRYQKKDPGENLNKFSAFNPTLVGTSQISIMEYYGAPWHRGQTTKTCILAQNCTMNCLDKWCTWSTSQI